MSEVMINEVKRNTFSVYANPIIGKIYIDLEDVTSEVSCKIYDINGRIVREDNDLMVRNTISFHSFPSGTYLIKVKDDYKVIVKRILKP